MLVFLFFFLIGGSVGTELGTVEIVCVEVFFIFVDFLGLSGGTVEGESV